MLFCIFIGVKKRTDMKRSMDYQPEQILVGQELVFCYQLCNEVFFIYLLFFFPWLVGYHSDNSVVGMNLFPCRQVLS